MNWSIYDQSMIALDLETPLGLFINGIKKF